MAHELAHGVTHYSSVLIYADKSGKFKKNVADLHPKLSNDVSHDESDEAAQEEERDNAC